MGSSRHDLPLIVCTGISAIGRLAYLADDGVGTAASEIDGVDVRVSRHVPCPHRLAVVFHRYHHHCLDRGGDLVLPPPALQPTMVRVQAAPQCPDMTSASTRRAPDRGGHHAWIRKERWWLSRVCRGLGPGGSGR
jgi:hypothetical protein